VRPATRRSADRRTFGERVRPPFGAGCERGDQQPQVVSVCTPVVRAWTQRAAATGNDMAALLLVAVVVILAVVGGSLASTLATGPTGHRLPAQTVSAESCKDCGRAAAGSGLLSWGPAVVSRIQGEIPSPVQRFIHRELGAASWRMSCPISSPCQKSTCADRLSELDQEMRALEARAHGGPGSGVRDDPHDDTGRRPGGGPAPGRTGRRRRCSRAAQAAVSECLRTVMRRWSEWVVVDEGEPGVGSSPRSSPR
jgi:hypothetical protein